MYEPASQGDSWSGEGFSCSRSSSSDFASKISMAGVLLEKWEETSSVFLSTVGLDGQVGQHS